MDMKRFIKERDMALITLVMRGRKNKLKKYARKYGVDIPKDENVLMAGACKALLGSTSAYIKEYHRNKAMYWLIAHGMKPWIGGIEL